MRTIVHISDLHFGRADLEVLPALAEAVKAANPDVVVVSGDLTQRAKKVEFAAAAEYLKRLPKPQVIVPGNHDIPLYRVFARWLSPLGHYRRYISKDLMPTYVDDEIAIVGLNTARSWSFKEGRVNQDQVAASCQLFHGLRDSLVRIVVTHHPFVLPELETLHGIVGRSEMAMTGFSNCNVDVVLSGHLHLSNVTTSVARYGECRRSVLMVQAGTASSSRRRREENAIKILRVEQSKIVVQHTSWEETTRKFASRTVVTYKRVPSGWAQDTPEVPP